MKNGKTLLISHTDLDGIGCIVLAYYFKDKLGIDEIWSQDYDFEFDEEIFNQILKFERVIITDLSLNEEKASELEASGTTVIFFDHHKTSEWITKRNHGSSWDDTRCGTKIFWEDYVKSLVKRYNPIIDDFVKLVDVYDLWQMSHPLWEEAKELNSVCMGIKNYAEGLSFYQANRRFIENQLKKFDVFTEFSFIGMEQSAIERAKKREEDMYHKAMNELSVRYDSEGFVFGVCSLASKISITASRILQEMVELDYLAIINMWGGLTGKVSFRSSNTKPEEDKFDTTQIGIANGHFHASAGMISPDIVKELVDNENMAFTYEGKYDTKNPRTAIVEVDQDA